MEQQSEDTTDQLMKLTAEIDWDGLGKEIANVYQTSINVQLTELKVALEKLSTAIASVQNPDHLLQETFTNWKEFLDMEPARLQNLQVQRVPDPRHGVVEIEKVPAPNNAYAKKHAPGAIYQSGTNEWYVESGTTADSTGGSGYLVTRQYVPERAEFRWFCTCIAAKRAMYSDNPYCKHMYAVRRHLRFEPLMQWIIYTRLVDMALFLHDCLQDSGFTREEREYIEDLKETFPALNNVMAHMATDS